jgi:hypothetical protein
MSAAIPWHSALGRFRSCSVCGSPWGMPTEAMSTWEHLCPTCAPIWAEYVRTSTEFIGAEDELLTLPTQSDEDDAT